MVEIMIPVEVGSSSSRSLEFFHEQNDKLLRESLLFIDDLQDIATHRNEHYKRATTRYHNSQVQPLGILEGDCVLRKNQASIQEPERKLDATWEDPY